MGCLHAGLPRRAFLGLLGVGLATVAAGCAGPDEQPDACRANPFSGDPAEPTAIQPVSAGTPQVLSHGPKGGRRIALTVDDGTCADCVAGYAQFADRSGVHLTFSPNGAYARQWEPQAPVLRPLIDCGQVQMINHTFTHHDLTAASEAQIRDELERNEAWAQRVFGVATAPYFRPPFGKHNADVDGAAAAAGFDRVVMWDGSFSDSKEITPEFLMAQARKYLEPGVIMLGHANHRTVLGLFDEILDVIKERRLEPVTLHEMFGTRPPGRQVSPSP